MLTAARPAAQGGFSVIELMVTIAILGLLVTLGLPQYSIYMQNRQIRASAEGILAGLQLARAEGVSRNVTGGVQFLLSGNDWSVQVPPVAPATTPEIVGSQNGKDRTPNAVVTPKPATATTVVFNGLGQMTSPTATVQIDVTNPTGGACMADDATANMRCLRITVSTNGQVRMCDPYMKAGDPQAC